MHRMNQASIYALACACGLVVMTPRLAGAQTIAAQGRADGPAAVASPSSVASQVTEVIVTAQKRAENIQNVGMSIQATSGATLTKLGVANTQDLVKIVPGLTFTGGWSGVPVFSIRGVGFEDVSLQASPAVSINEDEVPLPFGVESAGSTVDLQRVEVLKGPQGTLFGESATGGAINYIANKPTDYLEAGVDVSYGNYNTADISGFVSGPVTDTLDMRLALRTLQGDGWQHSYGPQAPGTLGKRNFSNGRFSLLWKPTDRLKVLATLSGFLDKSETQAPQDFGFKAAVAGYPLAPGYVNFPIAPKNNAVAAWSPCINKSPNNTHCVGYAKNNEFLKAALRFDYDLGNDLTITSLTSYQRFNDYDPFDGDGTPYSDYALVATGHIGVVYQELRLAGKFAGRGNWVVGGNYESDQIKEFDYSTFDGSSDGAPLGIPVVGNNLYQFERRQSYAVFVHSDYPITDSLTVNAGVRFTQTNIQDTGAIEDNGNGQVALLGAILQGILSGHPGAGINVGPYGITSFGPAPTYTPGAFQGVLDQNNVSWRVGLDWKVAEHELLYANVSQGYKAGTFPTLAAVQQSQYTPVTQEGLLAYEVGFKTEWLDRTLQLNGAAFYYDYDNKQIVGDEKDPVFNALPRLVNIPKSHVIGFELSAIWRPIEGLTITPDVSYSHSRIDGNFSTFDYTSAFINVSGERFPYIPEWQANVDAQYEWPVRDNLNAFVGVNLSYQGQENANFGNYPQYNVPGYALLDLRAGVEHGSWRFQLWGKNVTNQFYINNIIHPVDNFTRYTGMPVTYGASFSYRFH